MARQTPINTANDMRWLRDVHLPRLPAKYKSAIIVGNEDYPDRIEVYERRDPLITDAPLVFEADAEGVFRETAKVRHHATKKKPAQLDREIAEALTGPPSGFARVLRSDSHSVVAASGATRRAIRSAPDRGQGLQRGAGVPRGKPRRSG